MLPPDFVRAVRNIKLRGAVAILDFALNALPRFNGLDEAQLAGMVSISPSVKYLERAYDAAKYRQISEKPFMEITFPESDGEAIHMRVWAQYAPYNLAGGWDAAARETLLGNVIGTLEEYAPGIGGLVRDQSMLTPVDLEAEYGLTEGALYQGEIMLDQMYFMRPVAGYAQYRTPIAGLYLCGDGTHPGGGTVGAPAYNAAREILREL
jgi:phytoene dehydrogenase-like protein